MHMHFIKIPVGGSSPNCNCTPTPSSIEKYNFLEDGGEELKKSDEIKQN